MILVEQGVWQTSVVAPCDTGVATIYATATESGIFLVTVPPLALKTGTLVTARRVNMSPITLRQHHPWTGSWIPPVEGWPSDLAPSVQIIADGEVVSTTSAAYDGTRVTAALSVDAVNAVPVGALLELVHSDGTLLAQHMLIIRAH